MGLRAWARRAGLGGVAMAGAWLRRGGGGAGSRSGGARGGAGSRAAAGGRAGRGGFGAPRLGRPAGAHSFTRSRARERRRRQDEQYQERAGAGAEPQAGPQPGGRAGAVRQDPGERRAAGAGGWRAAPSPLSAHSRPLGPGHRPLPAPSLPPHPLSRSAAQPLTPPASAVEAAPRAGEPEARAGAGAGGASGDGGGRKPRRGGGPAGGQGERGAQVRPARPRPPRQSKSRRVSGKQRVSSEEASVSSSPGCLPAAPGLGYLPGEKFHECGRTCSPERGPTQTPVPSADETRAGARQTGTSFLRFPRARVALPGGYFNRETMARACIWTRVPAGNARCRRGCADVLF